MSRPPELRHLVSVPAGASRVLATDLEGCDIAGRARTLRVAIPGRWSLLLFLGSRCDGCLPFWTLAGAPEECGLEPQDTVAIVTRGPKDERPDALAALMDGAPAGICGLLMADAAWKAYRVLGAPFFVLLDGTGVATEGVAWSVGQLTSDVARVRRRPAGEAEHGPSARR